MDGGIVVGSDCGSEVGSVGVVFGVTVPGVSVGSVFGVTVPGVSVAFVQLWVTCWQYCVPQLEQVV